MLHPYTSCLDPSCKVSTSIQGCTAAVGFSGCVPIPILHHPAAYSSSGDASDQSSHHRTAGNGYSRSADPSASGSLDPCTYPERLGLFFICI